MERHIVTSSYGQAVVITDENVQCVDKGQYDKGSVEVLFLHAFRQYLIKLRE